MNTKSFSVVGLRYVGLSMAIEFCTRKLYKS